MNRDPSVGAGEHAHLSPARHVTASHRMKLLPVDFVPTEDDVICGRGKKCYSHVGNDRFRDRVHTMLALYKQARSKLDKSKVLNMVVDQVRHNSPGGGFVKQDESGRWFEVGDFLAREKTSQTFRDALHQGYKSSAVAKKKRRQEELSKASDKLSSSKVPRSSMDIAQKIKSMSLEMKNTAKNQVYTQTQTNADIMAGIQQASRQMRQDNAFLQQQQLQDRQKQLIGGFTANNNNPLSNNTPFQLEFEPEKESSYQAPARSTSFGQYSHGGGGQGQQRLGFGNLAARATSVPNVPPLTSSSSFGGVTGLGGCGGAADEHQARFMINNQDSSGAFSTESTSEEDLHHSVPSIQFDAGDLGDADETERMHRSAPNLSFYSPSELVVGEEQQQQHQQQNKNVPSTIQFSDQNNQFAQQNQSFPSFQSSQQQRHSFLDDIPMDGGGRGSAAVGHHSWMEGRLNAPSRGSIVSTLENLAQLRMQQDDNPFEPVPIDQNMEQMMQYEEMNQDGGGENPLNL